MLIADIKQMYRQVLVDVRDTPLQRIVWREAPDLTLETYELQTVTYGTASAPFLATRVLRQLADDEQRDFPEAAEVLRKDFYVDDLFSGGNNVPETINLRKQLQSLLKRGGFMLRKWASNEPAVLEGIPEEDKALRQSPTADVLRYNVKLPQSEPTEKLTKRLALSYIAQLFDPLGLVGPVVTTAKLFMQALWTLRNNNGDIWSWDEELPATVQKQWRSYHQQLPLLNQLKIDRFVLCNNAVSLQLHLFSDASEQAYGASAYLRTENAAGLVKVSLLSAKSKVAPLKKQSIPPGDTYLANKIRLIAFLEVPQPNSFSIVIYGGADLRWLQQDSSSWPDSFQANSNIQTEYETRKTPKTTFSASTEEVFIDWYVMLRVTAYCKRFLRNCRFKYQIRPSAYVITAEEKGEAEITLLRLVQQTTYPKEWQQLQQGKPISVKSRLKWFHPILDSNNLIRIGGRLNRSQQTYDSKHQIILPSSSPLSVLLVRQYHEEHLHAAPQLLLSILRLRYWVTGARNLARKVFHNCIICCRSRPTRLEQFMSELPSARITVSRPFSTTGIFYWGPIFVQSTQRRSTPRKAFVAVFVCFCTKAVHLELVVDLTTAKFLQAFRRFVSRRGLCSDIYSDNGRNFVGAANELRQLIRSKDHREQVGKECAHYNIRWHFNPPKASHFGGLWEAAIQSAQKHFVRTLGKQTLAYDDMETLLSQIECCLNSRPLVPLSDDPTDLEPLTPGHFLVGSALKAVPDVDVTEIPFNRLKKWQQTQKLVQQIWNRWNREYLITLQPRSKWCNPPGPARSVDG
ncbi:uncharacterized protein LOC134206605 [Armigeres subalbatus]|uniref:uncharacterized protein LOC134206605 n=1 Tax=Armigeres subalbatus TaxID=124917 RepID=UPI002ED08D72